jgi:hypothetical protein
LAPGLQKSDFENVSETNCWGEKTHSVEEGKQCAKERKGEKKRVVIFVIVSRSTTKLRQRCDLQRDPPHLKVDLQ